eukprot:10103250-Alexandrium_andersonii.AAC.1
MAAVQPSPPAAPASEPATPAPAATRAVFPPPRAEVASAAPSVPPGTDETVRRRLSYGDAVDDDDFFDLGE